MLAVWLIISSMLYSLRLSNGGSFPKPLTAREEREYLERAAQGDLEARNVLIERNLRLVAHIMKKYYTQTSGAAVPTTMWPQLRHSQILTSLFAKTAAVSTLCSRAR